MPPETIQRRARSAVENVANSFHDDYVRENAKFRSKAGIKCYIVRETDGNCCEWCTSLAGRYVYGEEPVEVFYHHDNCSCTVILENGRERQDVYSKEKWQVTPVLKVPYKPLVLDKNQAESLQKIQLAKYKNLGNGLTSVSNSDIMDLTSNYHSGIFDDWKSKLKNIFTNKSYLPVSEEYLNELPKKSTVCSVYEDMKATNPKYNDSYGYKINCQRCVPAYEMRRRGYNVTATPSFDDDILGFNFDKIFVDMKWETCSNGSGIDDIRKYMEQWGNGARAEISLQTVDGSHLFIAEQQYGITYFIDPQNYKADAEKYFTKKLLLPTRLCRIDNLQVSELIRECCEKVIE